MWVARQSMLLAATRSNYIGQLCSCTNRLFKKGKCASDSFESFFKARVSTVSESLEDRNWL